MNHNVLLFSLATAIGATTACGGCDDTAGLEDTGTSGSGADMADGGVDPADLGTGAGEMDADGGPVADASTDGSVGQDADASAADAAEMSLGPRPPLRFQGHDLIQEPRVSRFDVVPADDVFYVATSSAGDPVVFSLGTADELPVGGVGADRFGAIWARYDNDLGIQSAAQISSYPGGPRAGGTSNGSAMALEPDGARLMAGAFGGSVAFGDTTWSTTFDDSGGALATAYEGYVVRATDTTVDALYRLRTADARHSVSIESIVRHEDGDLTISGQFQVMLILPDDTTLSDTDGRGFVVHTDSAGNPLWILQTPSMSRLTAHPDGLLLRFAYNDAFRFAGVDYPESQDGHGVALALLDADGDVSWLRRVESPASTFVHRPAVLPDGDVVLPVRAAGATFLDFANPPTPTGDYHLTRLDAEGEPVWFTSLPLGTNGGLRSVAVDSFGIAWASGSFCPTNGLTFDAAWGADLVLPECDPAVDGGHTVLFGYDVDSGAFGYAHHVFYGVGSSDDVEVLSDERVIIAGHYYEPLDVLPGSADEFQADGLLDGANASTGILLLFE